MQSIQNHSVHFFKPSTITSQYHSFFLFPFLFLHLSHSLTAVSCCKSKKWFGPSAPFPRAILSNATCSRSVNFGTRCRVWKRRMNWRTSTAEMEYPPISSRSNMICSVIRVEREEEERIVVSTVISPPLLHLSNERGLSSFRIGYLIWTIWIAQCSVFTHFQ